MKETFLVSAEEANVRLDKLLSIRYKESHSRNYFQYLIDEGLVLLNGSAVKKQERPVEGDEISVEFTLTEELKVEPEAIPLDILFEDQHLIAINKPAGMVVHPAPGNWKGTFVNALLHHTKVQIGNESLRPGIVHRLDKDTSGVLLAAKESLTQQRLVDQFANREIKKEYLAVCVGNPGSGEIDAPIGRHPKRRKEMTIREDGGRNAVTRFETVEVRGQTSLVRLFPVTGRTHQIRVHMKHRGTPILGDSVYGNHYQNQKHGAKRQLLHAARLELTHPITGELLVFEAPTPEEMK